jgi:hypothetical protein
MEPEPAPKPFSHDRHVEVQSLFWAESQVVWLVGCKGAGWINGVV